VVPLVDNDPQQVEEAGFTSARSDESDTGGQPAKKKNVEERRRTAHTAGYAYEDPRVQTPT